jgi:tetratricopeptide (TPR) repeat protein
MNKYFLIIISIIGIVFSIVIVISKYYIGIINLQSIIRNIIAIIFYSGILLFYKFYVYKKLVYVSLLLLLICFSLSISYFIIFKTINITPIIFTMSSLYFNYLICKYLDCNNDVTFLIIASKLLFLNINYKYRLASIYNENKYYYKSIKIIKDCKNIDSYYLLANNYVQLNEYEKAIEMYTKILENDPNERPDILYNRGELYDRLGKYNETINDFKDCIKCQKPDPKAYIALGVIKNEQGEYEEAKEYFLKGRALSKSYDNYVPDKYK